MATYLIGFGLVLVFGYLSLILILLILPLTRTAVHHCSKCLEVVGKKKFYGVPSLKEKIVALKYGSMTLVMERIYFFIICVALMMGSTYYLYLTFPEYTPSKGFSQF